jgi:transposase-like protein
MTKRLVTKEQRIQMHIENKVVKGSAFFTDALRSYTGLKQEAIDHAECYAKGHVYTKEVENLCAETWLLNHLGFDTD